MEYLSSIVFHTVRVVYNYVNTMCGILSMIDTPFYPTQCTFMLENTNGVFIIDSIPHCPSDLQLCQQDSVEYYR